MRDEHVMLITGGISGEHSISLLSAANVWRGLKKIRSQCSMAFISPQGDWFLIEEPEQFFLDSASYVLDESMRIAWVLGKQSYAQIGAQVIVPDVVFPMVHGHQGEDGALQGLLEMAHLPYVGCNVLGSSVNMHKSIAKVLWKNAGLPVVPWLEATRDGAYPSWQACQKRLGEHLFVKAVDQGSSLGVYEVKSAIAYEAALLKAFRYSETVLIEKAMVGQEVEVAVLLDDQAFATAPGGIEIQSGFYDFSAKYESHDAALISIPAQLSPSQEEEAKRLALTAARVSYCRAYARVDLFFADGQFYINEINTIPGFTAISLYPKLMDYHGLCLEALLQRLLHHAVLSRPATTQVMAGEV